MGDNFYPKGLSNAKLKQNIKEKFSKPFANCNCPFYMVLGNHDYLGNVNLQTRIIHKIDDRWILPKRYYDFIMTSNKVKAHFICFDSNITQYNKVEWTKQYNWIIRQLGKTKNKVNWTILIAHHPWKSYGFHGNAQNTLKNLYETLTNKYPIDFILNGHDHDKQLIVTKNKTKQIITGTGSVIRFFPERQRNADNLKFFSETLGVCKIKLCQKKAYVSFLNELGNKEANTIFKPKVSRSL